MFPDEKEVKPDRNEKFDSNKNTHEKVGKKSAISSQKV